MSVEQKNGLIPHMGNIILDSELLFVWCLKLDSTCTSRKKSNNVFIGKRDI